MKFGTLSGLGWLLLVGAASLLLCAPFFSAFYDLADEGIFLRSADLMLHGKRLYADFFEFLPPGSFVLTAAWLNITGISIESARLLAVLTIVGISCFTFLTSQRACQNSPISALLVVGWLMMTQWHFMQISHHWFTTFFSMVAAWAALASQQQTEPRSLRWPVLAGAAAGIATMITQTCGAWATFAAATAFFGSKQIRKELIAFGLGGALVFAATLAFLAKQHTLVAAFDDVIRFPITRYTSIQSVPFSHGALIFDRPLKYIFLLAALLLVFAGARDWRNSLHDRKLRLCAAFALAGFLACFPRPDSAHVAYAVPLALPLLALCMVRLTESLRPIYRYMIVAATLLLFIPSAIGFTLLARTALQAQTVPTPRGGASFLFFTNGMPELLPTIVATPPRDAFFFYPHMPVLSFLTARDHVSKYDIFIPWYTTPTQYQDACLSAVRHASWVVIDRRFTDYKFWKRTYPVMPDTKPLETIRFEEILDRAFDRVTTKGTLDLRRRRQGISDDVCDSITGPGS